MNIQNDTTTRALSEEEIMEYLSRLEDDGMCCSHELCEDSPNEDSYIPDKICDLNKDNIDRVQFNRDDFILGVNSVSRLCGQITALVNVGITPDMALSYLASVEESDKLAAHNLEVSKISAESGVEMAKYGMVSGTKMSV